MVFTAPRIALASGLAALALGCTALADQAGAPETGPLSCSVEVTSRNGMLTLEGLATSDTALSGQYHLRVERGGTLIRCSAMRSSVSVTRTGRPCRSG